MAAIDQALSTKPVPADAEVIAHVTNREIVPVLRRVRAVLNQRLDMAAVTFGDGVATVYDVEHPFGTLDVLVGAYDLATGSDVAMASPPQRLDSGTVRITCTVAPAADGARALVRA